MYQITLAILLCFSAGKGFAVSAFVFVAIMFVTIKASMQAGFFCTPSEKTSVVYISHLRKPDEAYFEDMSFGMEKRLQLASIYSGVLCSCTMCA